MNTVFIHIPKCGGTSVRQSLREVGFDSGYPGHHTMKESIEELSSFKVKEFIVQVRNPYDRMCSAFNYMHSREVMKYRDINEWVELLTEPGDKPRFHPKTAIKSMCNYFDQTELPIKSFKLEENTIWDYLHDMGIKCYPLKLRGSFATHTNKTLKTKEDLNEQSKYLIQQAYNVDFERFNYEY
jgi:uncharacterized protein YjbK|tara:strand:- start:12338 stop:12886 length:549 start_codon:yes stop_codon:yes gene_type:complete